MPIITNNIKNNNYNNNNNKNIVNLTKARCIDVIINF